MQTIQEITEETLRKAGEFIYNGTRDGSLKKGQPLTTVDTGTTLSAVGTGVNLEAPAKQLVPLMAPFRQMIPRTVRDGAVASNWKAITALSSPKLSTTVRAAGAAFTTTYVPKVAAYKVFGILGTVDREQIAASKGFEPALAKETANTLLIAMKLEEQYFLGSNVTALATPGAPTVTAVAAVADTSGGGIAFTAAARFVSIAAMTLPAANRIAVSQPKDWDGTNALMYANGVAGVGNLTALDPASDGVTVVSATGTATPATSGGLRISWTAVPGAAAYIVFCGLANNTTVIAQVVTTQTNITLTSEVTSGGAAASTLAGTSADALTYDGIIAQLQAAGSGAFVRTLNDKLSSSGGEVVQIQDAFASIYNTAKIGKFMILVGANEGRAITKLGIAAGGGPTIFVDPAATVRSALMQGYHVAAIVNAITGDSCPVYTLPWLPGGTILILPTEIPYPDSNQPTPFDWAGGYDWERWDYASTAATGPVYPFEIRCYGVLRAVFTGGCGLITNVFKG